jgi:hypothetical protein
MTHDVVVAARPGFVPVGPEVDALARIATNLAAAGIYRKTAKTAEEVFAILLAARDMGVSATSALAGGIHMVDGKPEVSANLQAQLLREYRGPEGQRYDFRILTPARERSKECHIEFRRKEAGGDWEVIGEEFFSLEDAQRAGLTGKQVWKAYPKMMLLARCLSDGIASHCPETARGLRVYGESEIGGEEPRPSLDVEADPLLHATSMPAIDGEAVEMPRFEPVVKDVERTVESDVTPMDPWLEHIQQLVTEAGAKSDLRALLTGLRVEVPERVSSWRSVLATLDPEQRARLQALLQLRIDKRADVPWVDDEAADAALAAVKEVAV